MNPVGEVKEVHSDGRIAIFEWRLPHFHGLEHRCIHHSPKVTYFNREWHLSVNMTEEGIHYVCLGRRVLTRDIPVPVYYSIQCNTSDGEDRGAVRKQMYPERTMCVDIRPPWIIPPAVGVTLTCYIHAPGICRETETEDVPMKGICRETQAEDAPMKDFSIVSRDFKQMLLSGTGHDVLLKVGDEQFRAHKCVLQVRSPVFAAMFSNQMVESADGCVTIEDCDPDAFGQFLQFLYTGQVDITSVDSALGVFYVGDKYDIPSLKENSVGFMKSSFTATNVFEVASLASRHHEEELLQLAIVYFSNHLEEVLLTEEWQRFLVANPIQANEMYLNAAECLRTSHPDGPDNRKSRRPALLFS